MLTLIHLSDLHIHKTDRKPDNKNAIMLVEHLINRFQRLPKRRTLVVLTGDLTDDGYLTQYRKLRTHVLEPLATHFTLLPAPGNHDYARWGNVLDRNAPKRYADYVRMPHQKPCGDLPYPCFTQDAAERVLLVGLDSADPQGQVGFAEGIVAGPQRDALRDFLRLPKYRDWFKIVYFHHHPFDRAAFIKLHGADELLRVLAGYADLVLFGHKHKHEAFFRWYHVSLMLASGKVTEADGGNALAYRVLEIDQGQIASAHTEEIPRVE